MSGKNMTISAWILFGFIVLIIAVLGFLGVLSCERTWSKIACVIVVGIVTGCVFGGMRWYFKNTASGQRALVDQRSDLNNGIYRTVTIYTADGEVIAQYEGVFDIEGNNGGYVLFDYNGKRYTYYNCFVESIAQIE